MPHAKFRTSDATDKIDAALAAETGEREYRQAVENAGTVEEAEAIKEAARREAVSADTPEQDSGTPQGGSVVQHDSLKGEVHDG